jgi:hypothetical protein
MEMVIRDAVNPRVTTVSGTAITTASVDGMVDVQPRFADVGGGVRDVGLLVDGQALASSLPECSEPYASATPCPLSGAHDFKIDTRGLSDGAHSISFVVTDVAGNRVISKAYDMVVRTGPAAVPAGMLAAERPQIRATYDAAPVIRATLRDPAGNPLAGLKVGVAVRSAVTGAAFVLDTPVFSDASGGVTVRLPKGTSREVKLTYGDQTAIVKVVVRAPLRLRISPTTTRNGHSIRLSGSVPRATGSTKVELQAKSGRKWIPFKTTVLRDGRFSARYRFTRTFATTRYRFRAVIHGDPRFPYAPATSRVASVRVRP